MDRQKLASHLDLANHHPDATFFEIEIICKLVRDYEFNSAFCNPIYVAYAKDYAEAILKAKIKIGTVVSFPIGQDELEVKLHSAKEAVKDGADEIDVSTNVGYLKFGQSSLYLNEMKKIVDRVRHEKKETTVKFIIETGLLTDSEIKKASELVLQSGADFIKTCSGWGPRGASLKDVALIKEAVGSKIKIKVAGGIHTHQRTLAFFEKGADRIGTSKAVEIVMGAKK